MSLLSSSKLKCPRCGNKIAKRVVKLTEGKCNNCGYLIANSITGFVSKTVTLTATSA